MNQLKLSTILASLLHLTLVLSLPPTKRTTQFETIYQFPNETWIENISLRSNGNILVTLIFAPEVWEINPSTKTATLAHRFTESSSVFGIAEVEPDVFAVQTGNWSYMKQEQPGTWRIWTIDTCSSQPPYPANKVTDLPQAHYLEGMTILPTEPGTILSADSSVGAIYRVDTKTGAYSTAITSEYLTPNKTAIVPLGVNGIHTFTNTSDANQVWLYFTNTFAQHFLGRIPLTASGWTAGPVEEILPYAPGDVEADDFTLDSEGNAYVCTNSANSLLKVTVDGKVSLVAGGQNQSVIAGSNSAIFAKTPDQNILYVTTTGGIVVPPPSGIVGGKVVRIDLSLL